MTEVICVIWFST